MSPRPRLQTQCRLLALPPEIRNRIYDSILFLPTSDGKVTLVKQRQRPARSPSSVLAILQTCRQIHYEAKTTFYKINHLRARDLSEVFAANQRTCYLGLQRRAAIRALTVRISKHESLVGKIEWFLSLEILILELHPRNADFLLDLFSLKKLVRPLASLENLVHIHVIAPSNTGFDERCEKAANWLTQAVEKQRLS